MPGNRSIGDDWSPEAKLAVVIETASMSEAELGAYCRQRGLYPEQVQRWKEACLQGTGMQEGLGKAAQKQQRDSRKTIKNLESSLPTVAHEINSA